MRLSGTAFAAAFIGLCAAAAPVKAQTTLTMSTWLPNHAITRALVEWSQEVEKASNGRLKFNMLPKAVVSPPGTFDAVRDGLADISWSVHGYTPGRFPLTTVAEQPMLGDTSEAVSVAYQRIHDRYLAKADEHNGLKVLAVFTTGPADLYSVKAPIRGPEDANGMKVRVSGGIASEMAKLFNMSAVLKPPTEAYELLSSGIVDAITSGIEGIAAFKLDKLVRYWTRTPGGLYRSSFGVVMNQAAYDRLSAQDKAALDSVSGEKFARKIGQHWDKSDQEGVAVMKASGVEIVAPNAKFIEMIRSKPIEDAWLNAARPKGIDGAKVLAALREEIKNVEAGR